MEDLMRKYNKERKIAHLLQLDSLFGNSKKSSKRVITALFLSLLPLLIVIPAFTFLKRFFNVRFTILLITLVWGMYALKIVAMIVYHEADRVNDYMRRKNAKYTKAGKYVQIKNITSDGIVTFYNNRSTFFVVAYNGSQADSVKHERIQKFIEIIASIEGVKLDILVQNDSKVNIEFLEFYSIIKEMKDEQSKLDVLNMYRSNNVFTKNNTRILKTVYCFKTAAPDVKYVKEQVEKVLPKNTYFICKVADDIEAMRVLAYDIGLDLDIEELIINSHQRGFYYKSEVIGIYNQQVREREVQEDYTVRRI